MRQEIGSAQFEAWGGRMLVLTTESSSLPDALEAVRTVVDDVDHACSSFRDDSEVSRLAAAGGRPFTSSALLLDAVEAAVRAAQGTDGDVDPTVGEVLVAYGFTPGGGAEPLASGAPGRIARVPGYTTIEIDRTAGTIRVPRGVRLDLGATAKALAADRAAEAARAATGCGVLVSLCGDIALAGPPPVGGWTVRVTDDHRSAFDAAGQTISLREGGLATSSTTVRSRPGAHHVIDPATGRPAELHFRTVTVAAASCLDANTATTAAIVRGRRAVPWLRTLGLPSRLVTLDGRAMHLAGWPESGEDLPPVTGTLVAS